MDIFRYFIASGLIEWWRKRDNDCPKADFEFSGYRPIADIRYPTKRAPEGALELNLVVLVRNQWCKYRKLM